MSENVQNIHEELGRKLAGKYLTFLVGEETYGIDIMKIQEIIQMQHVTKVPRVAAFIRGVINLRGKVIPVIDLRCKFEMPAKDDTAKTCIIVVQIEGNEGTTVTVGLIIDEVREVLDIPEENIEPPTVFDCEADTSFILGMGKVGNEVKILLNIQKVVGVDEVSSIVEKES